MKFVVQVGEVAKQRVEFTFNQLLGRTVIRLDGRELKRSVRLFSEPLYDTHVFEFFEKERAQLRIEKRRKHLFSSEYFVYVNNRLHDFHRGI